MYLLLLNHRYSAISYIEEVAKSDDKDKLEEINDKIIKLKTTYSFRVISNDMIYQNVYSKMMDILNINDLMDDLQDNEQRMMQIHNRESENFDRKTNIVLFAISVLSIFS